VASEDPARLAERRRNSLLALFELSLELEASQDPFAMAQLALLNLMGHFGARRAAVWAFPEDRRDAAVVLRAFGLDDAEAAATGRGLREAPPLPAGPEGGAAALALPAAARAAALAVAVPLLAGERRRGAVALGERVAGEGFGAIDLDHLHTAARMLGSALENARLHQHTAEVNRRLRRANEELTEADRLKAQFVQNVNHEMRTPIAVLQGYLEILTDADGAGELQRRALEAMRVQVGRLTRMVQDLLEYSALAHGQARAPLEPVDAAAAVERCAAERRPGVLGSLRTIEVDLPGPVPAALGEPRRIARALDALVDNAVRFTPPGSRIVLRAATLERDGGRWVRIEVQDDGPGIPPERLERLFEAFRQGDGSSTREVGGLGLGLALAREQAESMDGRLEAESAPGRGTTFRLLLRPA
jgi:signal transduction histidine kinase